MTIGTVTLNALSGKYELSVNGKRIAQSKDRGYFEYHIPRMDVPKIVTSGVTSVIYTDGLPGHNVALIPTAQAVAASVSGPDCPIFGIDERFDLTEELATMTVQGTASKAMCIAGKGGIGKSFLVLKVLERLGKTDSVKLVAEAMARDNDAREKRIAALKEAALLAAEEEDEDEGSTRGKKKKLEIEDTEPVPTYEKVGDYRVYKGYSSPSALYRILYENRHRTVIFDDCDSILKNDDAVNLLKAALDTYEERWVDWNINSMFSDLPTSFRFEGQVIIITNLPADKVPEPIQTRCFNIDLAMTPQQALTRMRSVLHEIMPEVAIEPKTDAINLMEEYLHLVKAVNYRALMKLISIRIDPNTKDWKRLALFTMIKS